MLGLGIGAYCRFGKRLDGIPEEWSGDIGEVMPEGRRSMEVHYDLPASIFELFLGETMKYSMALWETGARSIDEAQLAMMADACEKMELEDGHSVLDIGCGFGAFARFVLDRFPNARVVALTMSRTQADYMRMLKATPGHAFHDRDFEILEEDFNGTDLTERFDRIVSMGTFEHVRNLKVALARISRWLKDDGACFLHYVVYREIISRFANIDMQNTFIMKYFFPNTKFWYERELFEHQDDLRIDRNWYLSGMNYAKTLRSWRTNFNRGEEALRRVAAFEPRDMRKWNLYFAFTEALFRASNGQQSGNGQYLLRAA
jgi:cyclopropane-fatty-acyl-phospholipid synthase